MSTSLKSRILSCTKYLGFLSLLSISSFCFGAEDWQPQVIGPFGTLNNRDNPFDIPAEKAQDLLNVNITQGGRSVYKRVGYGRAFTLSITTSPVHGTYTFYDSNGNTVDLFFNDTRMTSSVANGPITVIFSTGPFGVTYQCTDSLGYAYCVNSSKNNLIKTNGATHSQINSVVSTGSMITTAVTRLVMAGFPDRPNGIDFSADSNFTSWGTGGLGTSPAQLTINSPGSRITHITYAFGRLMWFKDTSFGYVLIGNQPAQSDWIIRTIAYDLGTNDNSSVYREGILYFRGQDGHIYAFDGSNYKRSTREISGTISLSQTRTLNSWTQSSLSDFQAGDNRPSTWISTSIVQGSVVLSSMVAQPSFADIDAADFGSAASIVNVSTLSSPGAVVLSYVNDNLISSSYPGSDTGACPDVCQSPYYSSRRFLTPNTASFASNIIVRMKKTGSPGNWNIALRSNSGGLPGTALETITVLPGSIPTSAGDVSFAFSSTTILSPNTTYWLSAIPAGVCDSSNKVEWLGTGGVGGTSGAIACGTGLTSDAFPSLSYKVFATSYTPTGNFTSRSFDMGFTTSTWLWAWSTFTVTATYPTGTTLTFETQTSSGSLGTFESLTSVATGSVITSSVQRFIRYKASFTTSVTTSTPNLDNIFISKSSFLRPGATYFSAVKNAPDLTAWDAFQVSKQDNGGNHTFSIRSATNSFTVMSSTPTWSTITDGSIPSISTGTYFQIKDQLSVSSFGALTNTLGPKLDDFTQNWYQGIATDKAYGIYFDDKIMWSVTAGTSTTNNRTLVYDMLNDGWILYDLPSNGFFVRQNRLYFGSSTGGYIYKYGDSESDDSAPINAYWKSKDFFGSSPFVTQEIANISVSAKSVANSSMTITYGLNGSSEGSFLMNQSGGSNYFVNKNKNLSAGTIGSTFNIKFGNNAADQQFEVFGIQVGIRPRPWIPTTP